MTKPKAPELPQPVSYSTDERREWRRDDSLASGNEDVRELTRTGVPQELWGEHIARWRVEEGDRRRGLAEESLPEAEAARAGARAGGAPSGDEEV